MKNIFNLTAKRITVICFQILIIAVFVQCKTHYQNMKKEHFDRQDQFKPQSITFVKPQYLKKGDTIMIVAPAGFVPDST